MANNKIKETPQYQIYLEVLEALKQAGYHIEERNAWQSYVKHGSENYGMVFVVDYPQNFGCLSIIIPDDILQFIYNFSNYGTMKGVLKDINNSRKRGKTYWPDYSLVGCFTMDKANYTYNDIWIKMAASGISNYA